ncbi:MAG TPA: cytochrome c [Anaerolineales bacterium]
MKRKMTLFMGTLAGVVVLFLTGHMFREQTVYALPEFAQRTNESCATCHVNPGGGGPRTMRGLIWSANGKPDAVPELPGILLAPGVDDGAELYQIACASCHGTNGEGKLASRLHSGGVQENKIRSTILLGRQISGMPSFDGQFTDEQFEALVGYMVALENGQAEPILESYPLESPQLLGIPQTTPMPSEGN